MKIGKIDFYLLFFSPLQCFEDNTGGVLWGKALCHADEKTYIFGIDEKDSSIVFFHPEEETEGSEAWRVVTEHFSEVYDLKSFLKEFVITSRGKILMKKAILEGLLECI